MTSFYRSLGPGDNFDHPDAFDFPSMVQTIKDLKAGKAIYLAEYDSGTRKMGRPRKVYGADIVIVEGILVFYNPEVRDLLDVKIFVDVDKDLRLARRLHRDVNIFHRKVEDVIRDYKAHVKPGFEEFVLPYVKHANVIVPRGSDNKVAIDILAEHIRMLLAQRGFKFRDQLLQMGKETLPPNVHVLKTNPILKACHTLIRDETTNREDFIFFADRIIRLLIEEALSFCGTFTKKVVMTPTGAPYDGLEWKAKVCGVSIVRAGEAMEGALKEVVKDVTFGKILIQTDGTTAEPRLYYCKLPEDIAECNVLLLDPLVGTGATAMMAIRVLLDHGVSMENITFVTVISAPPGLHALSYVFPKLKIITSEVDERVNDKYFICPGVGNFGDRHFGTQSTQIPSSEYIQRDHDERSVRISLLRVSSTGSQPLLFFPSRRAPCSRRRRAIPTQPCFAATWRGVL
eukprot:TRINITY_DN20151_c0_g1_i1.p1 TRINITY_DN20151_c0_g1~~TRINITY_DN20151_c0_g1_i1.p1  ORF type:complete len:527 (-),score=118.05 TRINITY_DN20151_c0_g1_i1:340-1710(-)